MSGHVPGRTARQCRERYVNLLQPDLKFQEFSKEEEEVRLLRCMFTSAPCIRGLANDAAPWMAAACTSHRMCLCCAMLAMRLADAPVPLNCRL